MVYSLDEDRSKDSYIGHEQELQSGLLVEYKLSGNSQGPVDTKRFMKTHV